MIETLLPTVRKILNDKAQSFAKGDGPKVVFKSVYNMLPGAIRLVVKEDSFVEFCMTHKNKLLSENIKQPKAGAKTQAKKVTKLAHKKTTKKGNKYSKL